MQAPLIFLLVLAQILLTIAIYVGMNVVKSKALKNGGVNVDKRLPHKEAWPDYVLKFTNNISNQFETPVLFYVLCIILWALNAVDLFALSTALFYVLTRIVHAYLHNHSN